MNLKQFFCLHRNLTAFDAYIPYQHTSSQYTAVGYEEPIIILHCDKCNKRIEMPLGTMQYNRHEHRINVDTTALEKYTFFGGTENPKTF